MINLKEHIGELFSASIYGVNCTGKIQIENDLIYLLQKILFISEYIVMLGQDDYCKATYTKLELYNDGWRLHN